VLSTLLVGPELCNAEPGLASDTDHSWQTKIPAGSGDTRHHGTGPANADHVPVFDGAGRAGAVDLNTHENNRRLTVRTGLSVVEEQQLDAAKAKARALDPPPSYPSSDIIGSVWSPNYSEVTSVPKPRTGTDRTILVLTRKPFVTAMGPDGRWATDSWW